MAIDPASGDLVMGDNDYRRGDAFGAAREYWNGAGDPFNSAAEPPGPEVDQPAGGARAAQDPEQPGEDEGENAYQVLLAKSTDGGASFGGGDTDMRELTGWSDVSLSGSKGLARFGVVRVTSSSMPPPTQFAGGFFGDDTGLAADRVAYPAWSDTRNPAPVLCPGTGTPSNPPRLCVTPVPNAPYNNDQEIYTAAVRVPSG